MDTPGRPFACTLLAGCIMHALNALKFGYLILRKIIKFVATRCQILRLKCTKFNFGQIPLGQLTALPQTL